MIVVLSTARIQDRISTSTLYYLQYIFSLIISKDNICFSYLLTINTNYIVLGFMKSWPNAKVVIVPEVVAFKVAISIDIPHVVIIVSRRA